MFIWRKFPFRDSASLVEVAGESVAVWAYQILVWVSLSTSESLDSDAPRFPTVLNTGHNHNFSIQERQLNRWAAISVDTSLQKGVILVNQREVALMSASLNS